MNHQHTFTRAEVVAHFTTAFCRDLREGETISIDNVYRVKDVSPACWTVDYSKQSKTAYFTYTFNSTVIIVARCDYFGNPQLRFVETEILPEESTKAEE